MKASAQAAAGADTGYRTCYRQSYLQASLFPFMAASAVRYGLPIFSGTLVGLTLFGALRGAGLGLNKAVWFGVGAGMALIAAFGANILLSAYIVGSHAFG